MFWHDYSSNQIIHCQSTSCNSCPTKRFNQQGSQFRPNKNTVVDLKGERLQHYILSQELPYETHFQICLSNSSQRRKDIARTHNNASYSTGSNSESLTTKRQTPYRISLQQLIILITIVIDHLRMVMYNLGFLTFEEHPYKYYTKTKLYPKWEAPS